MARDRRHYDSDWDYQDDLDNAPESDESKDYYGDLGYEDT